MPIDPNIALQAQAPDPMGQMGKILGVAQGAQNLQQSRFNLTQQQFQAAQDNFTAIAQDPMIAAAATEKDPAKRREYGKQILDKLLTHSDFAVQSGIPPEMVEKTMGPFITTATLHPERLQQMLAQRQQAGLGAAGQAARTQLGVGGQQQIKYDSANQPYVQYTDQFGNVSQHPMGWKPPAPNIAVTESTKVPPKAGEGAKPQEQKSLEQKPVQKSAKQGGVTFRSPEEQARIDASTKDIEQTRSGAGMIPQTKQSINKIIELIDIGTVGKGSKKWNDALAYLNTLTGGKIGDSSTAYQEANAYIDRLVAQQAQASGNQSVAAQNLTAGATGNVDTMNPEALKEKMRNLRGLMGGNEAYRKGLDFWVGTGSRQHPEKKSEFDAKFADAWDTDLFRMKEAVDNKDEDEMRKIGSKYSEKEWKDKWKKLNNVVPGFIPNYWK